MPRVSAKRQITLPKADCDELGIRPGDEVEILKSGNQLSIIKMVDGAAAGALKGSKINKKVTEKESLSSNFQ